jgi:serine/threonine protein kinase
MGKIAYASPEQANGKPNQIDIRTDVYALGMILYQFITGGEFPYEVKGSLADVLNNIMHAKPIPPSKIDKVKGFHRGKKRNTDLRPMLVDRALEAIVLKSLEKRPEKRYQSAGELSQDIRNYLLGEPTIARISTGPDVELAARAFKSLSGIAAVILLIASISTFIIALNWFFQSARQAPNDLNKTSYYFRGFVDLA